MSDTEDSRAASLGRKRRQNADVLQSARDAEKRRKLDHGANFVALDSDDNSETVSEDRESGEVSSAAHSPRAAAADEKPAVPAAQRNTFPPALGHAEHPSRDAGPSTSRLEIDVDAVYPDSFQKFVREQLQQRGDLDSVDAFLAEFCQNSKPFRKQARGFHKDWVQGYDKFLRDYDYHDLRRLVDDEKAFRKPLQLPGGKKTNHATRSFGDILRTECEKAPWKPRAAVAFDLLRSPKTHVLAAEAIRKYLDEDLLPQQQPQQTNNTTAQPIAQMNGHATTSPASTRNDITIADLTSDKDRRDQALYGNITNPTELVFCMSCGKRGHMQPSCPGNTCAHCSGPHFSRLCPSHQKCRRCRQRGHRETKCTRASKPAGLVGDECDVCGRPGHAEEECAGIWMTSHLAPLGKKIPEDQMVVSCYNCGRDTHWGDDCPALPDFVADFITHDTWSAKNAARYTFKRAEPTGSDEDDAASVGQEKNGTALAAVPAHQVAMLGDWA